ncbi:hypothetical protein E4U42_007393 [Claviceps africana]|uniref:Thiamine-binding protein domain-containing protein n=1 Tax=Claviceps africana TaxID=83212 RepID=A0A8K0J6V8_9HYPO|nr:hypothetical protein E4U42_007393 [Claviceps africana]
MSETWVWNYTVVNGHHNHARSLQPPSHDKSRRRLANKQRRQVSGFDKPPPPVRKPRERIHQRSDDRPAQISFTPAHRLQTVDYDALPTPTACYADFCLIPVGTSKVSVADEIALVQRVLQASGLKYTLHSAGTTVEGSWTDVMAVIGRAHAAVHESGVVRIQSSLRVGTRTDKAQTAEDKVRRIEGLLAPST